MLLLLAGWLAGAALAETAPASDATRGVVVDRVVAVVDDEVVTLSEVYAFRDYIQQQSATPEGVLRAEREVVELLIERLLVAKEIERLKLDVTDQELDRQIDWIAQSNNMDREALRAAIEAEGMTWDTYRSELGEQLKQQKFGQYVLRPRITISEDELKDRWRRSNPATTADARVLAIFLAYPEGADDAARAAVLARAQALKAQAEAGVDFGALSAANDQAGFGARGGEMGRFKPGDLMPALDAAVGATPVGQIAAPVATTAGVFVLKVADRGGDDAFLAARERIMDEVFQERLEDEQLRWFEQARRGAAIRILIGDPDAPPPAPAAAVEGGEGTAVPAPLAPTEPTPTEPAPTEPAPTEPAPAPTP